MPASNAKQSRPLLTRREKHRNSVVEEIKAAAMAELEEHGPLGLSMRAVARTIGITPSGLYRYFDDHEALMAALCVDAFDDLQGDLDIAVSSAPRANPLAKWSAATHAFRNWALRNPSMFKLIVGAPAPEEMAELAEARTRLTDVAIELVTEGIRDGVLSEAELQRWTPDAANGGGNEPGAQAPVRIAVAAVSAITGHVYLELFGHLNRVITDPETFFDSYVNAVFMMVGVPAEPATIRPAHGAKNTRRAS